jgi:hypothetical protein
MITVESFVNMIKRHQEEKEKQKKAEEPLPPPITGAKRKRPDDVYDIKLLKTYRKTEDDEAWRAWRKEQRMPSASMVSAYYKCGYKTLIREINIITGIEEEKEPDAFLKMMFKHGNDHEPHAKRVYIETEKLGDSVEWETDGSISQLFTIEHNNLECNILATPDMVIDVMSEHSCERRVVEIKCPTLGIKFKYQPMKTVINEFCLRYPNGKPGHFVQAATYALLFESNRFDLFYFFTNGIDYGWIKLYFEMSSELRDALFEAIHYCDSTIKTMLAAKEKGLSTPTIISAKSTDRIEKLMNESVVYCEVRQVESTQLQEESSDESEEQGPEVPGE